MMVTNVQEPLSWEEARHTLREILQSYLEDHRTSLSSQKTRDLDDIHDRRKNAESSSLLSKVIAYDLDLYCGALSLSVILLIVISLSLHSGRQSGNENNAIWLSLQPKVTVSLLHTELIGATLLVMASFINIVVMQRRRFLNTNDKEHSKRRDIHKFLRTAASTTNDIIHTNAKHENDSNMSVPCQLTSQTEVYPVFRKHAPTTPTTSSNTNSASASWTTIPSLLLVKGDWIALQVGDIAPAICTTIRIATTANSASSDGGANAEWATTTTFAAGERITVEALHCTTDSVTKSLPLGRTTLPKSHTLKSCDQFLTLCNNMQICVLNDSPISSSLEQTSDAPPSSQISRQVKVIREALAVFAFIVLVLTVVILFSRQQIKSNDIVTTMSLPILAALGALPLVGPAYLFGLEVLGTARILTAVHPYASTTNSIENEAPIKWLLWRYIVATGLSRLSLWPVFDALQRCMYRWSGTRSVRRTKLIRIPPASTHLLEKLGVANAFALIDDELACEPQSIPQQLLIPSAKGLKLLDLCPVHDGDENDDESATGDINAVQRQRGKSFDSDSESDDETISRQMSIRRKVLPRRLRRNITRTGVEQNRPTDESSGQDISRYDVQFEESDWWHFLPSLKCIGLACLLHDEGSTTNDSSEQEMRSVGSTSSSRYQDIARIELASLIRHERQSKQLVSLADCIGFTKEENASGKRGDISTFTERLRLHVLSNQLFKERLQLDGHERSSEQSRWWGLLRPDLTSVVVHDSRTKAFQLLTVGDPITVCNLCNEAWQGEISTILPFSASDKRTIIETTNAWKLADLDVTAFSYTPVPHTLEALLSQNQGTRYLLDRTDIGTTHGKDKGAVTEWSFLGNQIFLGVLGSLVIPRQEIRKLLDILSDAGVRFVYFSPRNMRRQKELAMQLGIDVAWNCAISLRPLESGEDDPHRMVSTYADWDVNAKLPHGVADVRKHLQEVDNVPLLVSLFTDATKQTTKEMVEIFHEYDDTVVAVGLSHLTQNEGIFASADISVGIDILEETIGEESNKSSLLSNVSKSELEFVQSISSQSCAFRLRGASSVACISTILEKSRASLDASVSSAIFLIYGCMTYSMYVLFSVCTPATSIPYVPTIGSALYLLFMLPSVGLSMQMTDGDANIMKRVPMKNDNTTSIRKNDRLAFMAMIFMKSLLPALLPQILHMISFGELVIKFDNAYVTTNCPLANNWVDIVRCDGMKHYVGDAKSSAGSLVLAQFILCVILSSVAFVYRFQSLRQQFPWERNVLWIMSLLVALGVLIIYVVVSTKNGTAASLPWYFYLISIASPFLCIAWVECFKLSETKQEERAEKVRRLQFETRLGAWSPR